jgi:photosystem II stability/assembly factor-like uncharacterized protein
MNHLPTRKYRSVLATLGLAWLSLASLAAAPLAPVLPGPTPAAGAPGTGTPAAALTPVTGGPALTNIEAFGPVAPGAGWLLADQRLYWTRTGGQNWETITPPDLAGLTIQAVTFLDAQRGRVILAGVGSSGDPQYALADTIDGGHTWERHALALFGPGEPAARAAAVYLQFIDVQTGWLVIRQATSSNFSLGTLFGTRDGGQTWRRLTLPIGEPAAFITPEVGWTAGGAAGNELYRTQDGGQTWQAVRPDSLTASQWLYQRPVFKDAQAGILPVIIPDGDAGRLEFHVTADGGQTWQQSAQVALDQAASPGVELPLAAFDAQHWVMIEPSGQNLVRRSGQGESRLALHLSTPGTLSGLKMISPDAGWAVQNFNECTPQPGATPPSGQCDQEVQLLQTEDGGQSWTPLPLPPDLAVRSAALSRFSNQTEPIPAPGGFSAQSSWSTILTLTGQGFDTCTVPTAAQLQTWITNSPYRAVNLYIGGSARACSNPAMNAALIYTLQQQGWTFIPTWVGPQAACSSFASRISYDTTTAYNQGVSEANAAIDAAAVIGLTLPDKSGTVIYYDLEAYGGTGASLACRQSAQAFMSGWTGQLHARGNQSGVYGGACSSAISDFASISNVPDAVWVAAWFSQPQYNAAASVFDISCLSNGLWVAHQRLRQYTYGHAENWGGVSIQIDSNAVDGRVASGADSTPPVATTVIHPLYKNSPFRDFTVVMSGTDTQSGVASFDLQRRDGASGTWEDAATNTTTLKYPYAGVEGHTYYFQVRARDNAGNLSAWQGASQYTVPPAQPVAADSYEVDNSPNDAKPFVLGTTQIHNFHAAGDEDWVSFTAEVNQVYLVLTSNIGGFADTVVELYAPDKTTLLAFNDDDPFHWPSSRLNWRAPTSGTYYLKVRHFDVYAFGLTTVYGLSITQLSPTFIAFLVGA